MMKYLFTAILYIAAVSYSHAVSVTTNYYINDVTDPSAKTLQFHGSGIYFGIAGGSLNYSTSAGFPALKLMRDASGYSMDCTFNGIVTRCGNLQLLNDALLPYVNEARTGAVNGVIASSYIAATAISTPTIGNPYTITESEDGQLHYITLGDFICATNPKALDNKVLQELGFYEKELLRGRVYNISWIHRDTGAGIKQRYCYRPSVTLTPENLLEPDPAPVTPPLQCSTGCVPAP